MIGTEVDVYWNLHRNIWSIRDRKTRRVIGHTSGAVLDGVTFVVSAAGNARVRREGRKNVHAFARGTLTAVSEDGFPIEPPYDAVEVVYNPYKHTTFVERETPALPVNAAGRVWLGWRTVWASGIS